MGARGAAIQGLMPFASQLTYCMNPDGDGSLVLDRDKLLELPGPTVIRRFWCTVLLTFSGGIW